MTLFAQRVEAIVQILDRLYNLVDANPPIEQPMRFGNKAFRSWLDQVRQDAQSYHENLLPRDMHGAIIELLPYFNDSFGNHTRIDYGTGHETSFISWLCTYIYITTNHVK